MSKKTKFNKQWLDPDLHPEFNKWLSDVPDKVNQAYCTVCHKFIELSNMGIRALNSHLKSNAHIKSVSAKSQQKPVGMFFSKNQNIISQTSPIIEPSQSTPIIEPSQSKGNGETLCSSSNTINSYLLKDDVLKAECLWAMHVVNKKMSYNSCAYISQIFQVMFPDSVIAKQFKLGSSKVAYLVSYGLAPYFLNQLMDHIKLCNDFVICFDEAFNKVAHKGQMDLVIRFWDEHSHQVSTRYLNSVFLGKATADDLLEKFIEGLSTLPLLNLFQVSMDGPNVNNCFLRKLIVKYEDDVSNFNGKKLLDMGTCGLHVVHGSLKHGLKVVKWDLNSLLTHMYFLFKDSPSRRAEFTAVTGSKLFPLKFCSTRWVENVQCLGRALEIFDHVKNFVENNKSLSSNPATTIKQAAKDPLMKCKLSFFKLIAAELEPFLKRFQSPKPLAPFLYEALHDVIRALMTRFVSDDKLKAAITVKQLLDIDLCQSENFLHYKKIDVGFAARKFLGEVKVDERDVMNFRLQCRELLVAIVEKLKERSPLKFLIVRGVSALDPFIIKHKPKIGIQRFQVALQCLVHANRVEDDVAEKAKQQYINLTNAANLRLQHEFETFFKVPTDEVGLDKFFFDILGDDKNFAELWKVVKMCLIFSHGNASVESGFSINKSLLIENLHETTLVNQRHVYDGILKAGGVQAVDLNKNLLSYVRSSHKRYKEDVENKRKIEENEVNKERIVREEKRKIKELEERRKQIRKAAELEEAAIELELNTLKK